MHRAAVVAILLLADDLPSVLKLAADRDADHRVKAVEALKESRDPRALPALLALLGDEHPKVRYRAMIALRDSADPVAGAKTAFRSSSPLVREGACEALGVAGRKDAVPLLLDRLADGDPRVQGEAAAALGRVGDPAAAERLIAAFGRSSAWSLRAFGLQALAALAPERLVELLDSASSDSNYQVRLVAAGCGGPEALAKLVADRDWRVRAQAIETLRSRRSRDSIGLLVGQFPHESGRLRWDLFTALGDLTGKDLPPDPAAWKAWWDANRETFVPPARGPKGAAPPSFAGETRVTFFKVPILSTRILFVLDLSGSMRDPSPQGETKLDVARKGMIETIRSLPGEVRFGILGLGCDHDGTYTLREKKTWHGRPALFPASAALKADAERFVAGLEAHGWTNIFDGIDYAFSDPDVDTVYLYSDGGASKGTFVAAGEILHHVAKMNRFRRIVLHTVEVPGVKNPPDNRRLLENLAHQTGGTCTLWKEPGKP